MPSYNFEKESEVHIVFGGLRYKMTVSSISFSQTFAQNNYPVKTLYNQNFLFDGSVINKANPAEFELSFPALKDTDFRTIFNLLVHYDNTGPRAFHTLNTFDLYVATNLDVYKLETAVITSGTFVIERSRPLRMTISGEATKLSYMDSLTKDTLPGTLQSRTSPLRYITKPEVTVSLASQNLSDIIGTSIELQNDIEWSPYTTVHAATSATDSSNSMYPGDFTLNKRILSGSVTRYVTDTKGTGTIAPQNWSSSSPIVITAGNGTGAAFRGFSVNGNCSFTNRIGSGSVYTQSFDWRLIDNPTSLGDILTYTTGA